MCPINQTKVGDYVVLANDFQLENEIVSWNKSMTSQEIYLLQFNELNEIFEKKQVEFEESLRQEKLAEIKFAELIKEI